VFWQLHCGIEGTYQAVLHDTRYSHGAPAETGKVNLHRRRHRVGWQLRRGHQRLGGHLLVSRSTARASLVNLRCSHGMFLSVGGDHEDRRFAQLTKDVRNLVVLSVIPPDHPDPAARWCLGEHLVGTVLPLLEADDTVERGLDLLRGDVVSVNLLKVPFYPLELPDARSLVNQCPGRPTEM